MTLVADYLVELRSTTVSGWNRFWFSAVDPATLCLIRILAGAMLLYTHLVWSLDLLGFFGPTGRVSPSFLSSFYDPTGSGYHFAWSYFSWTDSATLIWLFHLAALMVFLMLTLGLFTRTVSVLAFLATLAYVHRSPVTTFGLDQINVMLAMYLTLGPSGARYSWDAWRQPGRAGGVPPSTSANVAIRLIQLHLCIIYFFAGFGKLQGVSWWEGSALWLAMANYEYQSVDITWLGRFPMLINAMTHITLLWEISYIALIWPRLTRPIMLALAIPLHLGIGVCLGMLTFGSVMLVANLAFVSPGLVRTLLSRGR